VPDHRNYEVAAAVEAPLLASRRHFSPAIKRAAFARCNGQCEFERPSGERCAMPLTPGNRIYDHADPWVHSRDSSLGNCQVICTRCDRDKTPRDLTAIAKVRAVTDKHLGIKGPGLGAHPMAGGRKAKSPWKRKVGGGVKVRTTQVAEHARVMAGRFGGMAR
jgi:hypothetical protein